MSRSKQIGTALESLCAGHLKTHHEYPGAYRPALSGVNDVGDVHPYSGPRWIIECKSGKSAENASVGQIAKWIEEARRESVAAHAQDWILVVKRRGVGNARAGEQDAYFETDLGLSEMSVVRSSFDTAIRVMRERHDGQHHQGAQGYHQGLGAPTQ